MLIAVDNHRDTKKFIKPQSNAHKGLGYKYPVL